MNIQSWKRVSVARTILCILTSASLVWCFADPVCAYGAEPPAVTIGQIDVGFSGYYKVGDWVSAKISLVSPESQAVTVTVCAPDADDQLACLQIAETQLEANVETTVRGCFRTGRMNGDLQINVKNLEGRLLSSRRLRAVSEANATLRPALKQEVSVWATLGQPIGLDLFLDESSAADKREHRLAILQSVSQLPDQWQAYQSLDALFLAGSAVDENGKLLMASLSEKQSEALRTWVELGGYLVVSLGSEFEAWQTTPLASWLPITVRGQSQLRRLDDIERFTGRSTPLRFDGTVSAAKIEPVGTVLADGLDGPLILRNPHGFGFVTFIGLDLQAAPINSWDGLNSLFRRLLNRDSDGTQDSLNTESSQLVQVGISDLASQLQFVQDRFPTIPRRSLWEVLGLMVLYILLIGPVDYLVVHRLLARPEMTWVTFPLLVIVAMSFSTGLANWSNGHELQATQIDILDYDVSTEVIRGRTWSTIYSPEARRYGITVLPHPLQRDNRAAANGPPEKLVTWSAAPENCVGGLYRAGGLQLSRREYEYGPEAQSLENVPISTWSTKSIGATWHQQQPGLVDARLEGSVGQLSGLISHSFPFPVEDCMLAFGNRVYFPLRRQGREQVSILAPHEVWDVGRQVQGGKRELRGFLTNVRSTQVRKSGSSETEILSRQTPYDPFNKNREEIVRMLTFHEAAGGSVYTGMRHELLAEMDFSQHLRNGKAVFFGKLEKPVSELSIDGVVQKTIAPVTFVRMILPVNLVEITPERNFVDPGLGIKRPENP